MTLRHLKIFVSVYQNRSITKASKVLHLAQPSVSLAIKELETYYGICLFNRISRQLFYTESGTRFYNYALPIVSLFDEMEREVKNWESLSILRIGSSITIGSYILPELIEEFKLLNPDTKTTVLIQNSSVLEQSIMNNEIDLALTEGTPQMEQITQIPFMDDRLCLVCSPFHNLANSCNIQPKDLENYNFILRERGSGGREILESIVTLYQIKLKIIWESVSTQAIIQAVTRGIGISVLPYLFVKESLDQGLLIEKTIEGISFARKLSIIHHKNKYLTKTAASFIKLTHELPTGNKSFMNHD